jgi:hypothetical protein
MALFLGDLPVNLSPEVENLLDALEDVINQACGDNGDTLDSMALSAYARGMRVLAEYGRVKIEQDAGRRVSATWVDVDFGTDVPMTEITDIQSPEAPPTLSRSE